MSTYPSCICQMQSAGPLGVYLFGESKTIQWKTINIHSDYLLLVVPCLGFEQISKHTKNKRASKKSTKRAQKSNSKKKTNKTNRKKLHEQNFTHTPAFTRNVNQYKHTDI